MTQDRNSILILGTRGVPANHGGFETFAEHLALFLVEQGWDVSVYCQEDVERVEQRLRVEDWRGVNRIIVQTPRKGGLGTLDFDWVCVADAARRPGVCLSLGYNSAVFLPYLRASGKKILTNMDGIEWRRPKWSRPVRAWFFVNEWIAAWTSHRLIADHPAIANHLATRRPRSATIVIPYGGDPIERASEAAIAKLGLEPRKYLVSIARIEADNNVDLLVEAFSRRERGMKLAVLGKFDDDNRYHRRVKALAGPEVVFAGPIYEAETVRSIRLHARAYLHGHIVGGTNPSLVEALWAGNAVIAHDNAYNRWTADAAALYFDDVASCEEAMERLMSDDVLVARCGRAARERARNAFRWQDVLSAYESECIALLEGRAVRGVTVEPTRKASPQWS